VEKEGSKFLHDDLTSVGMSLLSGCCWVALFALCWWQMIVEEDAVSVEGSRSLHHWCDEWRQSWKLEKYCLLVQNLS